MKINSGFVLLGCVLSIHVYSQTEELRHLYFGPYTESNQQSQVGSTEFPLGSKHMNQISKIKTVRNRLNNSSVTECVLVKNVLSDLENKLFRASRIQALPEDADLETLLDYASDVCGVTSVSSGTGDSRTSISTGSVYSSEIKFSQNVSIADYRRYSILDLVRTSSDLSWTFALANQEWIVNQWDAKIRLESALSSSSDFSFGFHTQREIDELNQNAWIRREGFDSDFRIQPDKNGFDFEFGYDRVSSLNQVYDLHEFDIRAQKKVFGSLSQRTHSLVADFEKAIPRTGSIQNTAQKITGFYMIQGIVGAGANGILELGLGEFRNDDQVVKIYPHMRLDIEGQYFYSNLASFKFRPDLKIAHTLKADPATDYLMISSIGIDLTGQLFSETNKVVFGAAYARFDSSSSTQFDLPFVIDSMQFRSGYMWSYSKNLSLSAKYLIENRFYDGPNVDDAVEGLRISHLKDGVFHTVEIDLEYGF